MPAARRPVSPASSTDQALGRVEGVLAALEGTLASIEVRINANAAENAAERKEAAEHRQAIKAELAELKGDMETVKPITEKLERWQAIGLGALLTVGAIGSAIGAFLAYFREKIIAVVSGGG